jgi:Flp pilus assembly pilin Flp
VPARRLLVRERNGGIQGGEVSMRRRSDRGATTVEYAIIAAWIAAVIVLAVAALGKTVTGFFQSGLDAFP